MIRTVFHALLLLSASLPFTVPHGQTQSRGSVQPVRLHNNPIISVKDSATIGKNINGPSLIKVPSWLPDPLGRYYLYFAHHNGKFIRMAYAQDLQGPWTIYQPGTLKLHQTVCTGHIASPDVYVDNEKKEIRMYFHGPVRHSMGQKSFVAISKDGLHFKAEPEILGESYFRLFQWDRYFYAMARSGELYRSRDGIKDYEKGPNPFERDTLQSRIRHVAVILDGRTLTVFYSQIGDTPECILMSTIPLSDDWKQWKASSPVTVLVPEEAFEGADLPIAASTGGAAKGRLHELRDPAIYREGDRTYLLYSIAGENGIAISELKERR